MIIRQEPDIVERALEELAELGLEVKVNDGRKKKETPANSARVNKLRDTAAIPHDSSAS